MDIELKKILQCFTFFCYDYHVTCCSLKRKPGQSECLSFQLPCALTNLSKRTIFSFKEQEILQSTYYPKFCIGFKIRKSRCRTTFTLRFGSLKMIFECSIARCDVGLGRAIVQCQKNPLWKPKLSINRAILSAHFSAVKFCIGFFCWIGFFLVLHRLFSTARCS